MHDITCFQKHPPLFLEVSQTPQKNTYVGLSFLRSFRHAGLLHVCFSIYLIIHVISLFFNEVICLYCFVFFYSITFIDNRLITLNLKIDKTQTCLNSTQNNLFDDRPKDYNFVKKEALAKMFPCEFCDISRNIFFKDPGDYFWIKFCKF